MPPNAFGFYATYAEICQRCTPEGDLMTNSSRSNISPDMHAFFMKHAADAYDLGKTLEREYREGRKNLPRALMLPTERLSLRVSRHRHRIRIRWCYRNVAGESHCLVRLACYATKSGKPFLIYNKQTNELEIGGTESDVAWLKDIELRVWDLINHAERVSEFFQENKIPMRPIGS